VSSSPCCDRSHRGGRFHNRESFAFALGFVFVCVSRFTICRARSYECARGVIACGVR
jgi:hypothetical protein